MPSRALGPASEHCVFIYLHRTKDHTVIDYNRTAIEFLPEDFLHPMFLFLRPDGTEIDEKLRHEHMYQSGSQILNDLKKHVWPETGKGLTPKAWGKAKEALAKAREWLDGGNLDAAERALAPVLRLKVDCGVKHRAEMLREEIRSRKELAAAWAEIAAAVEDAPGGVAESIAAGRWLEARKATLRRTDLAGFRGRIEDALRKQFAVDEAHYQLIIAQERGHHYLEVSFRTGLPLVESLVLEVSALSDKGDVFEGHTTIRNLRASSRQLACATLSARALRGNLVKAFRARLWLGDVLVAEKIGEGGPDDWPSPPARDVKTGPDFFMPGDAFHTEETVQPEDIRVGRKS